MTPEESSDHLLKAITECAGGMVTGFVVMASFMADDGERRVYSDNDAGPAVPRDHWPPRLLALAVENGRAVRSILDDDE